MEEKRKIELLEAQELRVINIDGYLMVELHGNFMLIDDVTYADIQAFQDQVKLSQEIIAEIIAEERGDNDKLRGI